MKKFSINYTLESFLKEPLNVNFSEYNVEKLTFSPERSVGENKFCVNEVEAKYHPPILQTIENIKKLYNEWQPVLEEDCENNYNPFNLKNLQKYNSIYSFLFSNLRNYSVECEENFLKYITFNHSYYFYDTNTIFCSLTKKNISKPVFIKYSPLLDPIRYMIGKYSFESVSPTLCTEVLPSPVIFPIVSNFFPKSTKIEDSSTLRTEKSVKLEENFNKKKINENAFDKINNPYNASYIDNFFCYLSGQLLHNYNLQNCVDYYGSFTGTQNKFKINVVDDIDYLQSSDYFNNNLNKYFTLDKKYKGFHIENNIYNKGSHCNQQRLNIQENTTIDDIVDIISEDIVNLSQELRDFSEIIVEEDQPAIACEDKLTFLAEAFPEPKIRDSLEHSKCNNESSSTLSLEDPLKLVYENIKNNELFSSSSSSSSSSVSSHTTEEVSDFENEESDEENTFSLKPGGGNDEETSETGDDEETNDTVDEDDTLFAYINDFPIQMICLEKCDGTFDELLVRKELTEKECESAAFQIVMILAIFQKLFKFTHNDLHTNNIVFINTKVKYLYYKFEGKVYKVPTYGKIYKLIDFGRSIYTVNGTIFCSDSFNKNGDASTQYNFPIFNILGEEITENQNLFSTIPFQKKYFDSFYNKKKPIIEPNFSFDLCRLGCSIFDFVFDEIPQKNKFKKMSKFQKLIIDWCMDANGKNILYKSSGDERYPQFKLYKMIARTVHNCVPREQFNKPIFQQFILHSICSGKNVKNEVEAKIKNIMNIDEIPELYLDLPSQN